MHLLKKETLEINFPIFPIPNIIKDENEFEDELEYEYMTYIQGKSWISLKANDFKYMWDFFYFLDNNAFRYYFPAVILISFGELIRFHGLNDSALLVECTCQDMIGRMRDDLNTFKEFSPVQLQTILKWLLDLGEENSGLNPYDYKECVTWLSLLIDGKNIEII